MAWHGRPFSLSLNLPPLGANIYLYHTDAEAMIKSQQPVKKRKKKNG